jgi:hypothetical protein
VIELIRKNSNFGAKQGKALTPTLSRSTGRGGDS